jgi:hypothetical protein
MREIGRGGADWTHFTQNRDSWIDFCDHSIEPTGFIICGKFLELASGLSGGTVLHGVGGGILSVISVTS